MMAPRILFVSHTADWVGPTNSLALLLKHLRGRFDPRVLLPGRGLFSEMLEDEGIRYFSFPSLRKSAVPAMVGLLRREGFDLVYANNTSSSSKNALIASKLARVPFIYHIRAMCGRGHWRKVAFLRFADATIAVSAAAARSYSRVLHNRMPYVVHNGVTVPEPNADRDAARLRLMNTIGLPENATVIMSVGNVTPRKGQEQAVRAMARIVEGAPSACLLLLGSLDRDPQYLDRIRGLICELKLEERVFILGFRRDVAQLLKGADILLHTATEDPHPRAVIEGMAAGLPVVAFSADGVAETVLEGQTGHLVPAGDVDALSEAALRLVCDSARRAKFGSNGRRRVVQNFSAGKTAQRVGDIIDLTLKRRGRSSQDVSGRQERCLIPSSLLH